MSRPVGSKNKVKNYTDIEQKGLPPSFAKLDSLVIAPKPVSNSPIELIKLNHGFVGICNSRNATAIASTPLKLFAVKNSKTQKFLYPTRELNKKEVDRIKSDSKSVIVKNADNIVEIIEHPVFQVLNNVNNSDLNYYDGIELTASYLGMIGNAFWQIEMGKNKTPKGIRILPAEYTTVMLDNDMNTVGYRVFNGIYQKEYVPEEIIHFKNVSPGLFWRIWNNALITGLYGIGDCEYVLDEIYLYNSINDFLRALTENNAIPSGLIKYKNGRLDKNTMQDVQSQWDSVLRSWKKAGKVKVMDQDFDFTPISLPPKDLEFQEGRRWLRNVISNAYGVPEDLLMTENSNRASSTTAIQNYFRFTIKPKLRRIEERLNSHLMPLFDSDLFLEFDECVPNDERLAMEQEDSDLANGVVTINEVRERRGFQKVSWGDVPYVPAKQTIRSQDETPPDSSIEAAQSDKGTGASEEKGFFNKEKDADGGHWVTVNGRHIYIDGEGQARAKPGGDKVDIGGDKKPAGDKKPEDKKPEDKPKEEPKKPEDKPTEDKPKEEPKNPEESKPNTVKEAESNLKSSGYRSVKGVNDKNIEQAHKFKKETDRVKGKYSIVKDSMEKNKTEIKLMDTKSGNGGMYKAPVKDADAKQAIEDKWRKFTNENKRGLTAEEQNKMQDELRAVPFIKEDSIMLKTDENYYKFHAEKEGHPIEGLYVGKGSELVDYTREGIIRHELGHKVSNDLGTNYGLNREGIGGEWNKAVKAMDKRLANEYAEKHGKDATDVLYNRKIMKDIYRNNISGYATVGRDEIFAESFAAYTHEKYNNELPVEIHSFMSKYIK